MTSTFDSGRSPMSMVSCLSWECSDQADSGIGLPEYCNCYGRQERSGRQLMLFRLFLTSPANACLPACFPALLAPNRDREIGGGRATRQPGQVRKEAALTRSGSGRSSVSYLFFRANRAGSEVRAGPSLLSAKAGRENSHCGSTDDRRWRSRPQARQRRRAASTSAEALPNPTACWRANTVPRASRI